jgi:hypothetical protein
MLDGLQPSTIMVKSDDSIVATVLIKVRTSLGVMATVAEMLAANSAAKVSCLRCEWRHTS